MEKVDDAVEGGVEFTTGNAFDSACGLESVDVAGRLDAESKGDDDLLKEEKM